MTTIRRFFLYFLFFSNATLSYAQFYTVTKKREYKVISVDLNKAAKEMNAEKIPQIKSSGTKTDSAGTITKQLLHLPLEKIEVNSYYGYREDPFTKKREFHYGIDLAGDNNDVYAIMPGKIKGIGYKKKGLGNYVVLEHGEFTVTYGHLYVSIGEKGDIVDAGEKVGVTGNTGKSTGEHLHLSIKLNGKNIDPLPLLQYIENHIQRVNQLSSKE